MSDNRYKRTKLGSIAKNKDTSRTSYVKVSMYKQDNDQIVLKNGDFLQLETVAYQKRSAEEGLESGRLKQETFDKIMERLEKSPDWVIGELVLVQKD